MDPRDIWDVENIFDLVENNHNEFDNSFQYTEYSNKINEYDEDPLNDFYI